MLNAVTAFSQCLALNTSTLATNFTSPRSSICHKLCISHCTCNLFLRPARVSRDHIKRPLNVLPPSVLPLTILSPMEFQTNGSSFLSGMPEEGADSAHSSPLFPARSPTILPTSSLYQPLVPPFGQDDSPNLFSGYRHFGPAEPDFLGELASQNSGLFPPPST